MRRNLDEADQAIVERLSRDARVSNREIAEQLGVTEGTVRARVKRMEEEKRSYKIKYYSLYNLRNC